jgi:redox-sensitive bicupin YhaK (pirin superfamily)
LLLYIVYSFCSQTCLSYPIFVIYSRSNNFTFFFLLLSISHKNATTQNIQQQQQTTSHHNFWKWDFIFRKLSAFVLPEGFPAHPHRGFTTLTYFLPSSSENENDGSGGGGFIHRDSLGVKQKYGSSSGSSGNSNSNSNSRYKDHAQWLFTGSGMLHEEMFDFEEDSSKYNSRYELYQLWINVPSKYKLNPPKVQLLRTATGTYDNDNDDDDDDGTRTRTGTTTNTDGNGNGNGVMPTVSTSKESISTATTTNCDVVVIAGTYKPYDNDNDDNDKEEEDDDINVVTSQAKPVHSDLSVLHVTITETETKGTTATATATATANNNKTGRGWTYNIPNNHETLIVYVRKGSCTMETKIISASNSDDDDDDINDINDNDNDGGDSSEPPTIVPIHSTVFIENPLSADTAAISISSGERLIVIPTKLNDTVDLLVLSGRPLYADQGYDNVVEPIATQGSMVMNYPSEIDDAYRDYQYGKMGIPWDYKLNDNEWLDHINKSKKQ